MIRVDQTGPETFAIRISGEAANLLFGGVDIERRGDALQGVIADACAIQRCLIGACNPSDDIDDGLPF